MFISNSPRSTERSLALDPERAVPMNALAECLHNDPSNITGLVDRLERKGLVERMAHPTDRRVKTLALIDDGRAVRGRLRELIDEAPTNLLHLSTKELTVLRDLLASVAATTER
jgi:DNA-binding MarR family transcriptional regulator